MGTWSTKTAPNKIGKFGAETVKDNLPREIHHSQPHASKHTLVHTDTAQRLATYKCTMEYNKIIYIFNYFTSNHQQSVAPRKEVEVQIFLASYSIRI